MSGKCRTRLINLSEYVAIDIETTGFDTTQCEIIEVAGALVHDGEIVDTFQELVNPGTSQIPSFIAGFTGIHSSMLKDARPIEQVLPDYLTFIGDYPIVGQNITFDMRFIDANSQKLGLGAFDPVACDVMRFSRNLFPEMESHSLWCTVEKCTEIAGNKPRYGNAHRALADAETAFWCYEVMRPILTERFGDDPEEELRRIRRTNNYARKKEMESAKQIINNLVPTVEEINEDNPFYGTNVCFTGKLSCMTRKSAWQSAVNLGATPQQGVTKKTDYLVVGSLDFLANLKGKKSAKLSKAEKLLSQQGRPEIVSEGFFTQFIE